MHSKTSLWDRNSKAMGNQLTHSLYFRKFCFFSLSFACKGGWGNASLSSPGMSSFTLNKTSFLFSRSSKKKKPTGFPSLKAETINLFVCLCGESFFTSKNSCCPLKSCGQQPCCVSLTSWLQDINNTFTKAGWPSRKS